MDDFEPLLREIMAATDELLTTATAFTDEDVRWESLLPGWSRGHVLTHVARNADGGTRMLTWAKTGIETPEYASMEARAQEIEAGHHRGPIARCPSMPGLGKPPHPRFTPLGVA